MLFQPCVNPENQNIDVCCRDPNYVDPWQAMMNGGGNGNGNNNVQPNNNQGGAVPGINPRINDQPTDQNQALRRKNMNNNNGYRWRK